MSFNTVKRLLLMKGDQKHESTTKETKKTDDARPLLAKSDTTKRHGRRKVLSQSLSGIHDMGASPVFSLRRMVMLFENRDYSSCAALLNKLSMLTLTAVVEDFPVVTIIDNIPATFGILEVLYSRYFMTDCSIVSLQPDYLLDHLIRWLTTVSDLRSPHGCFGGHLTQVQNTLHIIAFQRRDIGRKLCAEQQQLKLCIVGLQKHGLVKTSGVETQTVEKGLKGVFSIQVHQMKRTLRKLEDITFDNEKQLKSSQTKRSSLKRQLSAQKSHHMTQGEIEGRLTWNTTILNAFEPVQTYVEMARLLQNLQMRIQADRNVLQRCGELRLKSHPIPRNADVAQFLHQVVQAYGKVLHVWSEVSEGVVSMSSDDGSAASSIHKESIDTSSLNSSWLALVNNDAFSDSTDGSEVTPEKASEATETIEEVSTPMGCTQGHEFPDEDDFPLPRSLPVTTATNGIAIERTTADPYEPFSMPAPTTVPPTVDNSEVVNLRNEVHVLKKELARCRDTVAKVNDREKKLKDRLSEQAQKQFLKGPTKFEDISVGAVRPTELIRSFGNLYTEARVEAFDALDDVPQMTGFDDLKGKLLFSIVVLSFRSVQQEILLIKRKIRDLLHMPETSGDPDVAPDDPLDEMAKELETMMSDYFRRTVRKQDIQKNIEEVSQQMCQTLYDYPGLKDSDGLKLYTEEVVRLAWALSVQNPPLFIVYDFKIFKPDELVRFHSSDPDSNEVKAVLWPALQEGIGGSIVHKAVVIT